MNSVTEYLAAGTKFQLGFLETEKPNPKTINLSELAVSNLPEAISAMSEVDCDALEILKSHTEEIILLRAEIKKVFSTGGRIFICGCGATGRLSLLLESLYREQLSSQNDINISNRVISFMAGGDVALVHSIEGFEDYPEYGKQHLYELGYNEKDLLIAVTEGGETPYVIGAAEAAAEFKDVKHKPYFIYCNPDEVLKKHVERSRRVLENSNIRKMNLCVGPMALTGSTRMQASTVLQLAVGFALLTELDSSQIKNELSLLQKFMRKEAVPFLQPFIEKESEHYLNNKYILYKVKDYGLTVFTDTTERAPTFSLTPFSHKSAHRLLELQPSKCFIQIEGAQTPDVAWEILLKRKPRPLNWHHIDDRTISNYLEQFDFSVTAIDFRNWLTQGTDHSDFSIYRSKSRELVWKLNEIERKIQLPQPHSLLFENTLLKMLMNIHSTLVMGRLGRFKRNMMTWVFPTNGKLIDRASRYVQTLLHEEGIDLSYEDIVRELFVTKSKISGNHSIVLETFEVLKKKNL